jgi:hypothetical protein
MIEVRLRYVDNPRAFRVMEVPFDQLDTVIPLLSSWGVSCDGEDCTDLVGQFVVSDAEAYFEVVAEP